jgi:hypothetical protein
VAPHRGDHKRPEAHARNLPNRRIDDRGQVRDASATHCERHACTRAQAHPELGLPQSRTNRASDISYYRLIKLLFDSS